MRYGLLVISTLTSITGCGELTTDDSTPTEAATAQASTAIRSIPVRIMRMCDGATCPNFTRANVEAAIAEANWAFEPIGIELWLRSYEEYDAPLFSNLTSSKDDQANPLPGDSNPVRMWDGPSNGQLYQQLRTAFPDLPADAWKTTTTMTERRWLRAAIQFWANEAEIVIIAPVTADKSLSSTEGRFTLIQAGAFRNNPRTFVHELGHYFGNPHTFGATTVDTVDPTTGVAFKRADRWDLVFAPGKSAASPHEFFASKAAAAQREGSLSPIDQDSEDAANVWDNCSTGVNESMTCRLAVNAAGIPVDPNSASAVYTETYTTGDPELAGIAWTGPDRHGNIVNIANAMMYITSSHGAFSPSQHVVMTKFLTHESEINAPTEQESDPDGLYPIANIGRTYLGTHDWLKTSRGYCVGAGETLYTGDFNGDGRDDLLCNQVDGDMLIDFANGKGEFWRRNWSNANRNFCVTAGEKLHVGDFNGDGRDDLLCNQADGDMFVDLANTNGEFWSSDWSLAARNYCVTSSEKLHVGDFNGDGRDDLLCNQADGDLFVDFANTSGEFWSSDWSLAARNYCVTSGEKLYVGDYNGDGYDDLLCNQADGDIFIDFANTNGEFWSSNWSLAARNFCATSGEKLYVGDYDGDGRDDLLCNQSDGDMFVDLANANGEFLASDWSAHNSLCQLASDRLYAVHLDGNARTDLLCTQANGTMFAEHADPGGRF